MNRFIVADLTSHKRGYGVKTAMDAVAHRVGTGSGVTWIIPSHLAAAFAGRPSTVIVDGPAPQVWDEIQRRADAVKTEDPNAEILVVTWDQYIYDRALKAQGLNRTKWYNFLSEDRALRTTSFQHGAPMPTTTSVAGTTGISKGDLQALVFDHLRSVFATSKETPIFRSQLRPSLAKKHPHLAPVITNPVFSISFKAAIESAIVAGLIGQDAPVSGQERIWLIVPPPEVRDKAPATPMQTRDAISEVAVVPAAAPIFARTAEFRKRLTDAGVFCEKRDRDLLIEALQALLDDNPRSIAKLRRELPLKAAEIVNTRGMSCDADFKRVVNFFIKLLLVSGVLEDKNGGIIKRNIGAEATSVAKLRPGALDSCEQYMLEQIMKTSDVKDREHWQLAHTLFRQFDQTVEIDEMLDRIAFLIAGLGSRFIMTDDGVYEYTETVTPTVVAMRA